LFLSGAARARVTGVEGAAPGRLLPAHPNRLSTNAPNRVSGQAWGLFRHGVPAGVSRPADFTV